MISLMLVNIWSMKDILAQINCSVQEEVQAEAERLERGGSDHGPQDTSVPAPEQPPEPTMSPQEQIDRLRARVADLSTRLEGHR